MRAVEAFSLAMHAGEIVGLAGPNGAGKSTLIALLLGYLAPTSGRVTIAGVPPRHFIERHGIGYLSELLYVPPRWRAEQALARYALLAGLAPDRVASRVDEVIELLGLEPHRRKLVKQLSKGNLQRLGLAQALLADERVIVLDEPTHGLDPVWTQRFRDVVETLRRDDRLIFIASHNLDELQRVADRVAIIDQGRLQRVVSTREPAVEAATPYRLVVARGRELVAGEIAGAVESPAGTFTLPAMELAALNELLGRLVARGRELVAGEIAGAVESPAGTFTLPAMELAALNELLGRLVARGVLVRSLAPVHSELEQQFREAVRA